MAASILPTEAQLATLTSLQEVRAWVATSDPVWTAFDTYLGGFPNLRMLALFCCRHLASMHSCLANHPSRWSSPRANPSGSDSIGVDVEGGKAEVCFAGFGPASPRETTSQTPAASSAAASSPGRKKVKANLVLDQMDESEIDMLSQTELDEAYRHHVEVTGWDPPAEAEPTPEQIAALKAKVVIRGEAPYADFSVLTPYGRRVQRQMKARSWVLQPDGTFKALEVPGPPTFDAWKACWRVYRAALFMLRSPGVPATASAAAVPKKLVVTPAALEEYFEQVCKLYEEFPETWHLIMQAGDKCRSEMFERFPRELTRAASEGKKDPHGSYFRWGGAMQRRVSIRCKMRQVLEGTSCPASSEFHSRGGRSMSMERAQITTVSDQAQQVLKSVSSALTRPAGVPAPFGQGVSKYALKRRSAQEKKRAETEQQQTPTDAAKRTKPASTASTGIHPKKVGDLFVTVEDGTEICFAYLKGKLGACADPCKNMRARCCQICLGAHPMCHAAKTSPKGSGRGRGRGGGK